MLVTAFEAAFRAVDDDLRHRSYFLRGSRGMSCQEYRVASQICTAFLLGVVA
jgi:hypothetical protein